MRDRCSTPWAIHDNAVKAGDRGTAGSRYPSAMPTVAVVCGSRSDLPSIKGCFDVLDEYGISWEASVISAHRQADALHAYVAEAEAAGVRIFIGAAGLAAHLPGVLASLTAKPVIGVPLDGGALGGADALYSVVQMPPGCRCDGRDRERRGAQRGAPRRANSRAVRRTGRPARRRRARPAGREGGAADRPAVRLTFAAAGHVPSGV